MNGKLFDTNILIYLSKRKLEFEKVALNEAKLFISVITCMEVMGFKFERNSEKGTIENYAHTFR